MFRLFLISLLFSGFVSAGMDNVGLVYAGDGGDAGTISIRNNTDRRLRVTYSGYGCDGYAFSLISVCGYGYLEPQEISWWDYGWGVTTTWVNVGDDETPDDMHPCSDSSIYYDSYCYSDHRVVDTDAREVDDCTFSKRSHHDYVLVCKRR